MSTLIKQRIEAILERNGVIRYGCITNSTGEGFVVYEQPEGTAVHGEAQIRYYIDSSTEFLHQRMGPLAFMESVLKNHGYRTQLRGDRVLVWEGKT